MNIDRFKILLNSENSKGSVNKDSFIKTNFEGKERILPPDVINKIINEAEVFNSERQSNGYYRILGTINSTISNALFNLDDAGTNLDLYTWKGFNYKNQNNDYRFFDPFYPNVLKNNLKEKDGWFGYYDPDITKAGFCNYFDMEPKRERFSFIPDTQPFHSNQGLVKNWEITITYPYSIDSGHTMVNNGLSIIEDIPVVISDREMTAFGIPCLHNLNVGDVVRISGTTGYDGEHIVVRTGLDNGDMKSYYFVIDLPPTGNIGANSKFKRVFGGFESEYYFRLFKKIKTRNSPIIEVDDYEIYKLAFSENAYYDSLTQFVFNEDIDTNNLVDNLGRPLSELYLTILKTSSNDLFTEILTGLETPHMDFLNTSPTNTYLQKIPVINKIHGGGYTSSSLPYPSHLPLETGLTINSNIFYGDLVEFNKAEVKETVLGEIAHRFNTKNRETNPSMNFAVSSGITDTINLGPRQEGYFYKPHNLLKIRDFSSYVEQGDSLTVGMPDYAINLGDGRYLWRDMLEIGYNEIEDKAINYPFINGCHYLYENHCFVVRRQDPFDNWDLFYSNYPSDPVGQRMTNKFDFNSGEYVC